ncbi:MAG: penicillin-binding protein 2 [Bacteroidales bacterium]|nr:penicillin-binding protein 2 [Bacteroidales bacterium]
MQNSENTNNKRFNARMGVILFLVLLLGVCCFGKILHLVIFQRALYSGTSAKCLDKTQDGWESNPLAQDENCDCYVVANNVRPVRGEIYDDHNRVMVSNVTVFDLTLDGRIFASKDTIYVHSATKLNNLIELLSAEFYNHFKNKFPKYDLQYYRRKFTVALAEQRNALILQSNESNERQWVTSEDTAFINHLPMFSEKPCKRCVNYTFRTVRINPYGDLAKRTLGMNLGDRQYGMEYYFDEQLAGVEGSRKYLYVNNARLPLDEYVEPIDGCDLHTTLNLEIQNIVHNELKAKLMEWNADWGCAIVMETKTGEIKAICNLRRANKEGTQYTESDEYALHKMVEPGSTFKIASALAYLEKKHGDDNHIYPILYHEFERKSKDGSKTYKFVKYDERGRAEDQGYPIDIIQRSSNVGIASMIFDAFDNNYKDYLKKIDQLYITTSFSTQLGKVQAPNIKRNAKDFHTHYNTCFGAGFTMTPIQTLVYYNAIANNGKMVAPLFVKYVTRAHETEPIQTYQAEVINERICSQQTIDKAKSYLEAVVTGEHGTARYYRNPNFSFAGKTGTRDIWDENLKAYNYNKNSISFCGYFPAEDPQYTCLVFMYNVSRKSSIAVDVFARIARNIMNTANYGALQSVSHEHGTKLPRTYVVNSGQYKLIMEQLGIAYPQSQMPTPYVNSGLRDDYSVMLKPARFKPGDKLPDVSEMIASDAVSELTRAGYKVKVKGYGVVRHQELDKVTNTVTLYLE